MGKAGRSLQASCRASIWGIATGRKSEREITAALSRVPPGRTMSGKNDDVAKAVSALRTSRRINVIGTSGTGKTTYSRALASVLGLPCHEMDRMFWQAGWTASEEDQFLARVKETTSGDCWILDGNYDRTVPIKWATVECVVWLDYPCHRTLRHAVLRAFRRSVTQEEIWPETGSHSAKTSSAGIRSSSGP